MPAITDILTIPRDELAKFKRSDDFTVDNLTMGEDQRITIYTPPIPGHRYVMGGDAAYGIEGRDYDTGVVLDKNTDPVTQVAEMEGRWGSDQFDRLCYVMLRYYFNAFFVMERQVGLPVLRSLINTFGYGYLYYNRDEASKGRRRKDSLGHHKQAGDPCIPRLRSAVRDHKLICRSERSWTQIREFQFRPKGAEKEKREEMRDKDLTMGAPSGGFDDLVNAWAYAWKGIEEVHFFEEDRIPYEAGKAGATLGMGNVLLKEPKYQPKKAFGRSGR